MFAVIQFICNRFIVSCKYTLLMIPSFLPAVQLSPKTARPRHFKLFGRWGAPSRSRSDPTHRWKKFHRCIPRRMPIYLEEFVSRGITVNIDHWRAGEMFCCHPFFWLVTTRLCGCVCHEKLIISHNCKFNGLFFWKRIRVKPMIFVSVIYRIWFFMWNTSVINWNTRVINCTMLMLKSSRCFFSPGEGLTSLGLIPGWGNPAALTW